jgi:hypothetical protein
MKNIIKTSAIILGTCFFAGKANAQMASEQPSQADRMVASSKKTIVAEKVAPVADKTAPTVTVSNNIVTTPAPVAKTEAYKQPVVSMQGVEAVKPKSGN